MDHPQKNDKGQTVLIKHPSSATSLDTWANPAAAATVTPGGPMPAELNGLALDPWMDAPTTVAGWNAVAGQGTSNEPPFVDTPGKHRAAGCVVLESDGRVWLVHPTNQYGSYVSTFPKGRLEPGIGFQASAIKEAYEESGLKVEITGWLLDTDRTTTRTRYFLARRVGGNPACMGWESQGVSLVPRSMLGRFLTNSNDQQILDALRQESASQHVVTPADFPRPLGRVPPVHTELMVDRVFSGEEVEKIRFGYIPLSDDDKWFMYMLENTLYFHRASSGYLYATVEFEPIESGRWQMKQFVVSQSGYDGFVMDAEFALNLIDYHLLSKKDLTMWIFLPNSMLSVVEKPGDAEVGTLTVRARVAGDIEAVFPDAVVKQNGGTDYRYRAVLPREMVAKAMHDAVMNLGWSNFKGAVKDQKRHDAYMHVWQAMFSLQERQRRD